jgi:drug/metabolite transporter (DMT)-like permease
VAEFIARAHRDRYEACMRSPDDSLRGILLLVLATMLFAVSDTTSKYLSATLPVIEFIWVRYALNTVFALCLRKPKTRRGVWTRRPALQTLRGVCAVGSSVLFVLGVRQMTMAQATSISFLTPLMVTVLSIPLLRERVGIRRWAAVGVGLLGVLIVVRPGLAGFQPAAGFGVAGALCWALALILTRMLANEDPPRTTLLWSSATGFLLLTLLVPMVAVLPTARACWLMLFMSVVASGGQFLVVLAHRHAPASTLAPFSYGQLIWVSAASYVVFRNLPDHWTVVGAAIIVASGLYTAHRERKRRQADVETAQPVVAKAPATV